MLFKGHGMSSFRFRFHPVLLDTLTDYSPQRLRNDILAGITVSVVALPLAMAFAIASGVKPEAGLFTAIIAGFLISALGGSRVQIGGPAGAFIVVIYGIIEKYGLANLLISTSCAGVLLFAMGSFRLGSLIRYIPLPIVIGFTNGIAVLIALSQLKDFFGLNITRMPGDFFAQLHMLAQQAPTTHWPSLLLALLSLLLLIGWSRLGRSSLNPDLPHPHWRRRCSIVPGSVVVLLLATLASALLALPVETIGSRFGGIPQGLPVFVLPDFSWELVKQLFAPTLTIALLGAIESLLCARIADGLIDTRHDPNQELMAQGVANFITPFFGGMPATGTIARTVTNIRSGATSPVSGIVHALTLLLLILFAAPLAYDVPLSTMAAILLYMAWNMGEWHEFARLRRLSMPYRILMLATFFLTVIVDLTTAVEVGLVLACVFFIYRISDLTQIVPITDSRLVAGVRAYSIYGSLFFGAVGKLELLIEPQAVPERVLILELHQLISIDSTGLDVLDTIRRALHRHDGQLILCGANRQPRAQMERSGFLERLGESHCVDTLDAAFSLACIFGAASDEQGKMCAAANPSQRAL
ncbi:MAG: SulP family sulfate permease [Candidatus Paceibacteria bacterium]|jgi:SulP family sulfate permease